MSGDEYFARPGQTLENHLRGVAECAAKFAEVFGARDWGYIAGLWHDLGKYQQEFQEKLKGRSVKVEHSGLGAALAFTRNKDHGIPLASAIAGHHTGLANIVSSDIDQPTALLERIKSNQTLLEEIKKQLPSWVTSAPIPTAPTFLLPNGEDIQTQRRRWELFTRFLYSLLVDADRLDSEAADDPAMAMKRGGYDSIADLRLRLDKNLDALRESIPEVLKNTEVNRLRADVLFACRSMAQRDPGIYSLTVPTGGGKTLSSMAFALRHAEQHKLQRIIVVIPYTSIIEQNAAVFRNVLDDRNVVEHHSNLDPVAKEKMSGEEIAKQQELACENWDAPIIVTTTVQFFETMFSSKSSRCRKLHNVAGSVIILDEVQTLPTEYLASILEGLNDLVHFYRCSLVLSTATPPALRKRERFIMGLDGIQEIISDSGTLSHKLARVVCSWPDIEAPARDWSDLAKEVAPYPQVLMVVHKRDDARVMAKQLASIVPPATVFHLSALMCPSHRSAVLTKIREKLERGEECRLISTQLVEAGVDVDFPVVYRALGGLDSIVQAAGRCNREGLREKGQVVVFRANTTPPKGTPKQALEVTETMLRQSNGALDPTDPEIFERFFRQLYFVKNLDERGVQSERASFNFATVGDKFQMIEDGFTYTVVVPYGEAQERLARFRHDGPSRETIRALQPFTVNIYQNSVQRLEEMGALERIMDSILSLLPGFDHLYDKRFGLVIGDTFGANPASLIV
jgi:CRISPR-associated endonuclease/helicase Cas3